MEEIEKSGSYSSKSCDMSYDGGSHHESLGAQNKQVDYQESVTSHLRHTGFFIDQTPTPTRFFKHYEDVSLFQDINLNPFDLEFRKASQSRSSKIYLTVSENHGISGSLDTPRILPPVESDETISSTSHEDSHIQVSTSRALLQLSSVVTPVISESDISRQNSLNLAVVERNEGRKKLTLNVSSASEEGHQSSNIISTPTPVITAGPSVSQTLGIGNLTPILNTPTIVSSNIPHISLNGVELSEIGSPVLSPNFRISSPSNEYAKNTSIGEPVETNKLFSQSSAVSASCSVTPSTVSYSNSTTTSTPQSATVLQLLLRLPNGQSIPVEIPATPVVSSVPTGKSSPALSTTVASVVPAYPATAFTSVITNPTPSLAKMKLKQVLSTSNTAAKPGSLRLSRATTADRIADLTKNRTSPTKAVDRLRGANTTECDGPKGTRRRKSSPDEDPEEKRKKFLERNRVAAVRCREKKKRLVESMFARTDELNALNQKLQVEVVSLRSEVAALKCLLLKHKSCPVTLAMQGGEDCFTQNNLKEVETPFEIQSSSCITQASDVQPMVQNISNTSTKISPQNVTQDSDSFIVSDVSSLDAVNKVRKRSHSLSSISYSVPLQPIMVNAQNVSNDGNFFVTIDGIKKEPKQILPKENPLLLSRNSMGNSLSLSASSSTAQSSALPFSESKIIVIKNHHISNNTIVPQR